jgi:hypothetical protein
MKVKGKTPRDVVKPKRRNGVTPKPVRPPSTTDVSWHIYRLRKSPADLVGYVQAKDAESAVRRYIDERQVPDPREQKRLFAMRSA